MRLTILFTALMLLASHIPGAQACTTMIITKGASADGSAMVAHSDDDELGDQRLIRVPSTQQEGQRAIFRENYPYPRLVTDDRGPFYNTKGHEPSKPIGTVPYEKIREKAGKKDARSYAYFDGNYGIMNEHNLMMGECTNAANFEPGPVSREQARKHGKPMRLFYSSELSRIALENCRDARTAVKLMGWLIDEYGYYSTGETLLVADENEAWVMEMCALPNKRHHSAWVAKRVPDGEFFVAANEFRIRDVQWDDPDNFLYSEHLKPGLKALDWWDGESTLDWLRAVSPGEYNHPYYSLRRVWRVFDRVNPSLGLSPWVDDGYTRDYPFSIKPQHKLTPQDVFSLYRDHYEGTQFDLTRGTAAGPYGDPHRFVGPYDGNQNDVSKGKKAYGAWERAISVFYQGYTFVCQTRPDAPEAAKGILWFGPDVSYTTVFTPFFAKAESIPAAYQTGSPQHFDRKSAWWAFDFVGNWSRLNFQQMTRADIIPLQQDLEDMEMEHIAFMDEAIEGLSEEKAVQELTEFGNKNAEHVLTTWRTLGDKLVAKYSDGYINVPGSPVKAVGYPSHWLKRTDYSDGPTSYDMK
ncbi:dipeptidase [Desulfovibrio oxyclinae]|uniref:dipeptidase n=1 Tax=Desulfovibrio oxyclinae TaxID=63560 RepID=UPI0003722D85|nr:C69 family dipeptidase [Desulfovibrio oxyclinae]